MSSKTTQTTSKHPPKSYINMQLSFFCWNAKSNKKATTTKNRQIWNVFIFFHAQKRPFFSARREFADFWAVEQGTTHKNWSPSTSVRNACFKKSKWYKYLYFQFHVSQFFFSLWSICVILLCEIYFLWAIHKVPKLSSVPWKYFN